MTAAVLATTPHAPVRPARPGVTFPRVLTAEWIKFRSVRSTLWTLPITAVAMVGMSVLQAWGLTTIDETLPITAAEIVTGGWFFAQLSVAVLAILSISGEYSTGMIRSSFTSVPRRLPVLAAKAMVVFVAVAVVSLVAVALSWPAALPFLDQLGLTVDLGDADTVRILLGTPLYLGTIGLFAFAVGALVRHSAGALAAVLGMLLVVENVFAALPFRFFELVSPFLPSTAGGRLLTDEGSAVAMATNGPHLTPWEGYGVLAIWVAVLLTAAAVLMRRRDA
jgi:ABC-2 type transport system permease protein